MSQKMNIEFKGAEFDVEYTYSPEERETFHQPGVVEAISVSTVAIGNVLLNQFFEEMDLWEQLEETVLRKYKGEDND